jgi:hypothetical protein
MAKYRKFEVKQEAKAGPNPIWRGIGCILIVVVPVIAYLLTALFLQDVINTGYVPPELLSSITFPPWVFKVPILDVAAAWLGNIPALGLKLILFFMIVLVLGAVSSLLYTAIQDLAGKSRYTDKDAPPSNHRGKAYKR